MSDIFTSNESLRLMQSAPAMIWRSDIDGKCYWFNDTWLAFSGRTVDQELGVGWTENVHPDDLDFCSTTILAAFADRRRFEMEYRVRRHDGVYRWILDQGIPSHDSNRVFDGYTGFCFDITDRKALEQSLLERSRELEQINAELQLAREALEVLALRDSLTGLSNRHDILRRFGLEMDLCHRLDNNLSLLLLDLGFFKAVNDRHGHLVGDECLKAVARVLQACGRAGDIVGRFGGEEFIVILPDTEEAAALAVAETLRRNVAQGQFSILGQIVPLTVSIGGATRRPGEPLTFNDLAGKADGALYRAEAAGRNQSMMAEIGYGPSPDRVKLERGAQLLC